LDPIAFVLPFDGDVHHTYNRQITNRNGTYSGGFSDHHTWKLPWDGPYIFGWVWIGLFLGVMGNHAVDMDVLYLGNSATIRRGRTWNGSSIFLARAAFIQSFHAPYQGRFDAALYLAPTEKGHCLALMIDHPDYLFEDDSIKIYRQVLKDVHRWNCYCNALPREVAA
jgi:hypothetical protein